MQHGRNKHGQVGHLGALDHVFPGVFAGLAYLKVYQQQGKLVGERIAPAFYHLRQGRVETQARLYVNRQEIERTGQAAQQHLLPLGDAALQPKIGQIQADEKARNQREQPLGRALRFATRHP